MKPGHLDELAMIFNVHECRGVKQLQETIEFCWTILLLDSIIRVDEGVALALKGKRFKDFGIQGIVQSLDDYRGVGLIVKGLSVRIISRQIQGARVPRLRRNGGSWHQFCVIALESIPLHNLKRQGLILLD